MAGIASYFQLVNSIDPTWVTFKDDFFTTLDETNVWNVVKDAGATAAIGADAANGTLVISSAATTDNDGGLVQSIQEYIVGSANKAIYLETKVKLSDATQTDFYFGLSAQAETDPENILSAASRIGFEKLDGTAELSAVCTASSVTTKSSCQRSLSDATYAVLSIYFDGTTAFFYVNGNQVQSIATNVPADEMAVAMFHLSGNNSGTKTSTWDYVFYAGQR